MKNIKKYVIIAIFLAVLIAPNISSADTIADLQAQISALLAQIQKLQQQLAQMQGQPTTWCHDFNVNLKFGDSGDEVAALYATMSKEGLETQEVDYAQEKAQNYFGEGLASAVSGFQQKYKDEILAPWGLQYGTGYVGKTTRAKLNSLYGCGVTPVPPLPVCACTAPICASGYTLYDTGEKNSCGCSTKKCILISGNQPPVISGVSGPTALNIGQTGTWIVQASDPEQGVLSYSVGWGDETPNVLPAVHPSTGVYTQTATFTHSYSKAGIYNPTFIVTDNQGLSAKTSISVNVGEVTGPFFSITVNPPVPQTTDNGIYSLTSGSVYTFTGTVKNAQAYQPGYLSLRRPDGSLKYDRYFIGQTDSTGYLSQSTTQTIIGGQTGTYIAWINVGTWTSGAVKFNIYPAPKPSITVISPNGGEVWTKGESKNITWNGGYTDLKNEIRLIKAENLPTPDALIGYNYYAIKLSENINGGANYFNWVVGDVDCPSCVIAKQGVPEGRYIVRIIRYLSTGEVVYYDDSDAPFSIVAAGQPILSVAPDATFQTTNILAGSSNVEIGRFLLSNNNVSDVKIASIYVKRNNIGSCAFQNLRLYSGTTQISSTIAALDTNCGALFNLSLTIPKSTTQIISLKVDVPLSMKADTLAFQIAGISGDPVNVIWSGIPATSNAINIVAATTPSITVLSPNGGEQWQIGSKQTIKWTSSNIFVLNFVRITLRHYPTSAQTYNEYLLKDNTPNDGVEEITSWPDIPLGTYRVYIKTVVGDRIIDDSSNSVFSITAGSDEFNNAATVAQTFKKFYGHIDYLTFNGEEFEQGFVDACSSPVNGGLNNCQGMARVPAKGAVDHAFLYKKDGDPNDLAKAKYLIGKMVNLYDSWKTINSIDFHSWSLNAGVSYALGLASWIIWDELDSPLQQSVKYIIVNEANQFLKRQPTSRETNSSWGMDTKAEENASVVGLMAMAANFFPEEANASQWEAHAKLFAYHSVTVAKDAAYGGVKTITAFDNGDAVGVFRKTTPRATFYLDYDGDFIWSKDIWDIDGDGDYGEDGLIKIPNATWFTLEPIERRYNFGYPTDLPFAGDWNGDGLSEIGVYRPSENKFYLDTGDGMWQTGVDITSSTFGMAGDVPIIGDWNGDGKDEIGVFRIESDGRGLFSLDYNGNRQWDSGIDKTYYFGTRGDIPVAGKWNNSSNSYIGVYRPSTFTFYLDWDGNYQWSSSSDKSYAFRPTGASTNLVPIVGNWNDNDTGRDAIGVYDADNGIFYPDFNNDFRWDTVNESLNLPLKFGTTGDIPVVGHWQNKQRFWIVNHAVRPQVDYMAAEPAFLLRAFLVYKKANKPIPSELTHNILSLWNNLKQYIDPTDFSWNVYTDWQNTGLSCTPGAETLPCLALGTDCDFERRFLAYKATNSYARTFIEKPVTAQTQFLYPDPGDGTRSTILNYVVTERFIIVALSHDPSLLPSLPLRLKENLNTTAPTINKIVATDRSDAPFSIVAEEVGQSSTLNQMASVLESMKNLLYLLLKAIGN